MTLKASKIRAALVQRGILDCSTESSKLSSLSLLRHLFSRWLKQRGSSRERACQFRIFQSAVAELQSSGDIFEKHLPKIGKSSLFAIFAESVAPMYLRR